MSLTRRKFKPLNRDKAELQNVRVPILATDDKYNSLFVYMNGEHVGEYIYHKSGAQEFYYSQNWLEHESPIPLSLSLPLQEEAHVGQTVINYFDNLLPDNLEIRRRIQRRFQVKTAEPFDLLSAIGRDCVGAIQLLSDEQAPNIRQINSVPLSEADIAELLQQYQSVPMGMLNESEDFRISIAGAQEKTALLWHENAWHKPLKATPTTHILKLPIGNTERMDLSDSVENEFFCSQLLKAFGMPIANTRMVYFENSKALCVERFDRRHSEEKDIEWIERLPQEDMCQALGVAPALKYEAEGGPGIADIMQLLNSSIKPEEDRFQFMKSIYLFWVLGAIDGHAKNFSLFLYPHGQFCLTPLYDVMSAYSWLAKKQLRRMKMAMALRSKNAHYDWHSIQKRHWFAMADKVNFPPSQMTQIIEEVATAAPQAIEQTLALLPADFPDAIATPIVEGIHKALAKL